jgi:hypothetical protein
MSWIDRIGSAAAEVKSFDAGGIVKPQFRLGPLDGVVARHRRAVSPEGHRNCDHAATCPSNETVLVRARLAVRRPAPAYRDEPWQANRELARYVSRRRFANASRVLPGV